MAIHQQSQEMEASEVNRLLEGRTTYAMEKAGHRIYYIVPQEEKQDAEGGFRVFRIGQRHPADPPISTRCVLLLGETGAGKTTFINAVLNYLFGVEFDDPYRLQVEEKIEDGRRETDSHTDIITVYTVYYQEGMKHEYNFVLIDTPGLADTRGEQQQKVIMRHLEALFTLDLGDDDLHQDLRCLQCLGVVAKGNTNRRLDYQKALLQEINLLLGNYVPDITHIFATFALENVSVDAVVKDCGINYKSMLKFDNGSLFCPKETDEAYDPRKRWKKMTEQYDTFFDALIRAPSVSIEILREKKLYDTCKKNITKLIELLATSVVANYHTKKMYEKYESLEENNKDWKEIEIAEVTDEEELENGTHAHNCNTCKHTCRICSKTMCKVIPPSPTHTAMAVGNVGTMAGPPVAEAITASSARIFATTTVAARVVPVIGAGIGLAAGLVTFGAMKAVTMIRGGLKCENSDCRHPNSDHVIEPIKKTKRSQENEIIHEDKKKNYEFAVSKKSDANVKLIAGQQKVLSRINRLSKDTVELLYHAKRIHELTSQGFDYMKDINCYLDGIKLNDHNCSIHAEKYVVHVLKAAMQELDSCTTEQVCGNHRHVVEMLSGFTKKIHVETIQLRAASE